MKESKEGIINGENTISNALENLVSALRNSGLEIPETLSPTSSLPEYSQWFAVVSFWLQMTNAGLRDSQIDQFTRESAIQLEQSFTNEFDVPIPSLPAAITYSQLGFWMAIFSSATSHDNWCRHSAHGGKKAAMQINRSDGSPEIAMTCTVSAHDTEYHPDPVTTTPRYVRRL